MTNPRSTASIAGHPIHPMLIPFPVAFFVATLVCDVAFWRNGSAAVATAATWLLGAGIVMALLAAIVGLTDVLGDVSIGDHAKIGANSVVTHDVPAGCTAIGVPARLTNCPDQAIPA